MIRRKSRLVADAMIKFSPHRKMPKAKSLTVAEKISFMKASVSMSNGYADDRHWICEPSINLTMGNHGRFKIAVCADTLDDAVETCYDQIQCAISNGWKAK